MMIGLGPTRCRKTVWVWLWMPLTMSLWLVVLGVVVYVAARLAQDGRDKTSRS